MVCMDGFILTHAYERVDMPSQEQVDAFLPPYVPRQVLDTANPVSIGAMVGPEAFSEVRYLAHAKQMQALELIPQISSEFKEIFGRESGGLVRPYRCEDADTIVVALGSVIGTIKDTVDEMRADGHKIGVLGVHSFRPFPVAAIRRALSHAKRIVVLEKSIAIGIGGIVATDVRLAMDGLDTKIYTVVAGLGGRNITRPSLHRVFRQAENNQLESLHFLDLEWDVVNRELDRERNVRRSGPIAENILKDLAAAGGRQG
jgi:pyruvate ferredoxin oxidoreductase alpha subunit